MSARNAVVRGNNHAPHRMISIILPVYNEAARIPALLLELDALQGTHEVIFSDGGSTDATLSLLAGQQVVQGARGRGAQCNRAAARAKGDVLFFLHCDSRLESDALLKICEAVEAKALWGCLTLQFDRSGAIYHFGAALSNLRARWRHLPFGDQGIFITTSFFKELGGFPPLPLMEDYQLALQLKALACPPVQIKSKITTSARRFHAGGPLRVALKMWRLRWLYRHGQDIQTIHRLYRDVREPNG